MGSTRVKTPPNTRRQVAADDPQSILIRGRMVLEAEAASISGVNLDEELANMILLENAYAASARIINTTAEMYDILLSIVG